MSLPVAPEPFQDHIYKVLPSVSLPLRIWPAVSPTPSTPWLFWTHGGGFLGGKHFVPNTWIIPAFRSRGYHVISVAYRLGPQAHLVEIMQDVLDAQRWCLAHLESVLEGHISLDSYLVGGDSAGGYLALRAGLAFQPRPKVVLCLYGITEPTDEWYSQPTTYPDGRHNTWPTPVSGRFPQRQIEHELERRDGIVRFVGPWPYQLNVPLDVLQHAWKTEFVPSENDWLCADVAAHIMAQPMLFKVLCGVRHLPEKEALEEIRRFSPIHLVDENTAFPTTLFLHGTGDVVVPVEHSYRMAARLKQLGLVVGENYPDGEPHVFDMKCEVSSCALPVETSLIRRHQKPEDDGWDEWVVPTMDFVDQHMKG
ncbi:hypothetical protein P7C73_g2602, partial [Tremellales sp. Uapishka_1]